MSNLRSYTWIWVLLFLVILSGFFQFYSPKVFDPDAFYHITHAKIYRAEGTTFSEFPWTQFSVIKNLKADIWYGFHLLLTPLTFFKDLVFGIKFGSFLLTAAVLFSFYILLKKLIVRWPLFWVLLFFFFIPDTHYRFLVLRPHLITFALSIAIFYFSLNKKHWAVFITSTALAFIHLTLAWIPVLIVLIVLITDSYFSKRFALKTLLAVLAGSIIGWLARPNFIGAIKLAYIQVVELVLAKFKNIPLRLGAELRPANNISLFTHELLPTLVVLILAATILILALRNKTFPKLAEKEKTAILGSLAVSAIFGLMTVFIARRAIDLWVGFTFIFAGLVLGLLAEKYKDYIRNRRTFFTAGGLVLAVVMLANTLYFSLFKYPRQSPDHRNFQSAGEWLRDNTQEKEIVFHAYWDNFPLLFFYNQKNYYINGMDPIFLNSFDPSLNIKYYFFNIDKLLFVEGEVYTCGANPCVPGTVVSAYDAITKDFGAKYIFVEPLRSPRFHQYLKNDARFQQTFVEPAAAVFKVL